MKRLLVLSLVGALSLTGGCVKMTNKATINNDASGTVSMNFALNTQAIEQLKSMMEGVGDMGGGGQIDEANEALDTLEAMFDEKKFTEKLKGVGLEITSAKRGDKDGWKTMDVEGKFSDINVWIEKSAKDAGKEAEKFGMPMGKDFGTMTPKFYKTDRPNVGEIVLIPAMDTMMQDMPMDLEMIEEMGDEERDMIEGQMDRMKTMFFADQMKMEMVFTLPGKILDVKGAKKEGDNGIKFAFSGSEINLDGLKTMFGFKNGISATFEIPEDCKIKFQDKKAPDAEKAQEPKEEPKEKKGGLKIGGDK
jgi:hypothetical protein